MQDSGCRQLLVGLESPRAESLDGLELKSNWKMKQLGSHAEAVARIQAHGIKVIGCFVLGLDGDTPEVFREVHDYAIRLELSDINFVPKGMSVDELQEGFLWLVKHVYSAGEAAARIRRFKEIMRGSPQARRRLARA